MSKIIDKLEKFNDAISNHYMSVQINFIQFGINSCFQQLYLIPTIELDICKTDISISFYVLWSCLYLNFSLKNYKTDES